MSGYLQFNYTGVKEIDAIISELEYAGDSYHHTSDWSDSRDGRNFSHIELIQQALDKAAKVMKEHLSDSQEEDSSSC